MYLSIKKNRMRELIKDINITKKESVFLEKF